jgi:hypothetical protein
VVQRKIGLELELQVPVDALGNRTAIDIAKLNYGQLGNAGAREKQNLYRQSARHVRVTVDSGRADQLLALYNRPFPRVMNPSIVELVIDPPVDDFDDLATAVARCVEIATSIDQRTNHVAGRGQLLDTVHYVGLVNNELANLSRAQKVEILRARLPDLDGAT